MLQSILFVDQFPGSIGLTRHGLFDQLSHSRAFNIIILLITIIAMSLLILNLIVILDKVFCFGLVLLECSQDLGRSDSRFGFNGESLKFVWARAFFLLLALLTVFSGSFLLTLFIFLFSSH